VFWKENILKKGYLGKKEIKMIKKTWIYATIMIGLALFNLPVGIYFWITLLNYINVTPLIWFLYWFYLIFGSVIGIATILLNQLIKEEEMKRLENIIKEDF